MKFFASMVQEELQDQKPLTPRKFVAKPFQVRTDHGGFPHMPPIGVISICV